MSLKPSDLLSLVVLIITLAYSIIFRNDWKEGLIIGFIFIVAVQIIELRIHINESNENLDGKLKNFHEKNNEIIINEVTSLKSYTNITSSKLIRLLKIDREYFYQKELFEILRR